MRYRRRTRPAVVALNVAIVLIGLGATSLLVAPRHTIHKILGVVVTADDYRQLEAGMTYRQVERIVGSPGREISRDILSATYQWRNRGGATLTVRFVDDRLIEKTQSGLD